MPSLAAYTIYIFGCIAFAGGFINLLSPSNATAFLGLPDSCSPASNGLSVTALAMGIYYFLAAYQENRGFFWMTVWVRLFASFMFWSQGGAWNVLGSMEGTGALITATFLLLGK